MILVVDDDPRIRSGVVAILRQAGHEVFEAGDGVEGLAFLAQNAEVSLVVSDVMMPRKTGPEMVGEALAMLPDLKIVYMSGDTGAHPPETFAPWPLLAKPFTAAALLALI